jgi:hypothetical protein
MAVLIGHAPSTTNAMKPIRIQPIQLPSLPNSMGRPTPSNSLDRRYATGWGRTPAQQQADQNKRRFF